MADVVGWRCPGCSRCYAPRVRRCATCGTAPGRQDVEPFAAVVERVKAEALSSIDRDPPAR